VNHDRGPELKPVPILASLVILVAVFMVVPFFCGIGVMVFVDWLCECLL
jgi:hypothetical protein